MSLSGNAELLIGILHSVNLLSLLSCIEIRTFPIDSKVSTKRSELSPLFEELLTLVCDLTQFIDDYQELRESLDSIIDEANQNQWDEEATVLYLSFLKSQMTGVKKRYSFSFFCRKDFKKEIEPIILHQLESLIKTSLWLRFDYYTYYPQAILEPTPFGRITRIVALVRKLANLTVESFDSKNVALTIIKKWLQLDSVVNPTWAHNDFQKQAIEKIKSEIGKLE